MFSTIKNKPANSVFCRVFGKADTMGSFFADVPRIPAKFTLKYVKQCPFFVFFTRRGCFVTALGVPFCYLMLFPGLFVVSSHSIFKVWQFSIKFRTELNKSCIWCILAQCATSVEKRHFLTKPTILSVVSSL